MVFDQVTLVFALQICAPIQEPVFTANFAKRGEKPKENEKGYYPYDGKLHYNWHGKGVENGLLTTLKDEGQYQPLEKGKTINFFTFRIGQGVGDTVGNTIIEPDKEYRVFGDSIGVSEKKGGQGREWNDIKAEKKGTSIVAIGYEDGVYANMFFEYNPDTKETFNRTYQKLQYFPEVDPDRIGIAIFDVDGSGEKIKPNISRMTSDGEKPLRKYDREIGRAHV